MVINSDNNDNNSHERSNRRKDFRNGKRQKYDQAQKEERRTQSTE